MVRNAAKDNYRFASLVSQVVASDAFRRRESAAPASPPAPRVTSLAQATAGAEGK